MKRRVYRIRGRWGRLTAFVLTATTINVRADVVDIAWDATGRFETLKLRFRFLASRHYLVQAWRSTFPSKVPLAPAHYRSLGRKPVLDRRRQRLQVEGMPQASVALFVRHQAKAPHCGALHVAGRA